MRFKDNWKGYLFLGFIMFVLAILINILSSVVLVPIAFGTLLSGDPVVGTIMVIPILVIFFLISGFVYFKFIKSSRFG